jgi:hypothetical protein
MTKLYLPVHQAVANALTMQRKSSASVAPALEAVQASYKAFQDSFAELKRAKTKDCAEKQKLGKAVGMPASSGVAACNVSALAKVYEQGSTDASDYAGKVEYGFLAFQQDYLKSNVLPKASAAVDETAKVSAQYA